MSEQASQKETLKNLMKKWNGHYRTGIAQTLGIEPEEVKMEKAWKREWLESLRKLIGKDLDEAL